MWWNLFLAFFLEFLPASRLGRSIACTFLIPMKTANNYLTKIYSHRIKNHYYKNDRFYVYNLLKFWINNWCEISKLSCLSKKRFQICRLAPPPSRGSVNAVKWHNESDFTGLISPLVPISAIENIKFDSFFWQFLTIITWQIVLDKFICMRNWEMDPEPQKNYNHINFKNEIYRGDKSCRHKTIFHF